MAAGSGRELNGGVTTIAGRYELDPVHIGKGGMGEVWGATDTRLRRRVAVKFVRFADDPELIRRFVRESQLTARMAHPGVPVLYDADKVSGGPFDGRLYLVMELVEGINVDDLVAEHDPLPIGWAAAIAAQVCAVLSYAHGKSLVHRDLKPSNLMVDKDGAVKVLDFGLAVALDADERSRLTSTNQTLGTLAYMSPEQFRGGPGRPATCTRWDASSTRCSPGRVRSTPQTMSPTCTPTSTRRPWP